MPDPSTTSDHLDTLQTARDEPPQSHAARKVGAGGKGRRGRPRQDDYIKQAIAVLRADLFQLDTCAAFTQLPGVHAQAKLYSKKVLSYGLAIRILMDQAVDETQSLGLSCGTLLSQRIAVFLRIWYEEGGTVVQAAQEMGLSRSYIVHHVQPRALELVARRFLDLAGRVESAA